ncbi:hypothetical protein CMV_024373 [Castanea mollissima]|uniref:RNA helicase n=1 Tax=Castanea mollissima TaxID=60419 RepID=A0A8J4VI15_9ROSI|nr:hypothetical protein CMV_024373 [Castanea mollissima]
MIHMNKSMSRINPEAKSRPGGREIRRMVQVVVQSWSLGPMLMEVKNIFSNLDNLYTKILDITNCLKENGTELPDYLVRTLLTIIHAILPPPKRKPRKKEGVDKAKYSALAIADSKERHSNREDNGDSVHHKRGDSDKPSKLSIQEQRQSLPIYKLKRELIQAMHDNQVLVLIGETGSGKF